MTDPKKTLQRQERNLSILLTIAIICFSIGMYVIINLMKIG